MGRLNDKMTQLADKIRVKNMGYPYRMSIDKMIELIDNLDYAVWFGDALPGDVSAGMTFSSYSSGKLQTGTMPDTAVSIAGNIVTVPAGRIREEQILTVGSGSVTIDGGTVDIKAGYVENGTLTIAASSGLSVSGAKVTVGKGYLSEDDEVTIQSGSAAVNGNTVTITEGYLPEQTVTISSGSVSIDRNKVTVTEGYVQNNTLTVQSGSVTYHPDQSKVIVAEGYISDDEIDIPAGFQLVKVTNYHPAREGFDAVGSVVVSVGNVEGEYGAADFSDVDGTYVVTPETQYKKGMERIYKQQNGRYYLCGYEPENDWGDSPHWYISETIGNYGWNSKMYFNGNTIPSGANSWYSEMVGNFTMTTTLNIVTVEGLSETTSAVSVTGFDDENADWQTGEAVDVSGYSLTPQTDGIYYLKGGKLIGQHIDRELNIPQDGLVRRWKAVGKHLVETFWGTEMLPDGEISFDESGYCGNTAAPLSKGNSCMYTFNTYGFGLEVTLGAFVKPYSGSGMIFGFGSKDSDQCRLALHTHGVSVATIHSVDLHLSYGKWNSVVMTLQRDGTGYGSTGVVKVYANGKFIKEINDAYVRDDGIQSSFVGILNQRAVQYNSDNLVSMVDEACVWNRILTDEEIAEMAKGVQTFNWDIPVQEYVQKQPVLYAPLSDASKYCPAGQRIYLHDHYTTTDLASSGFFRDGAFWNYRTNDSGSLEYENVFIGQNDRSLYTSGSYTVCVDVYDEGEYSKVGFVAQNYKVEVLKSGIYLTGPKTSDNTTACFKDVVSTIPVPKGKWTTIIARSNNKYLELFTNGELGGSGTVTDSYPFEDVYGAIYYFVGAIRNIRIYNRAITDEEIAELSGVKPEEE